MALILCKLAHSQFVDTSKISFSALKIKSTSNSQYFLTAIRNNSNDTIKYWSNYNRWWENYFVSKRNWLIEQDMPKVKDSTILVSLPPHECQTKAFKVILNNWLPDIPDIKFELAYIYKPWIQSADINTILKYIDSGGPKGYLIYSNPDISRTLGKYIYNWAKSLRLRFERNTL